MKIRQTIKIKNNQTAESLRADNRICSILDILNLFISSQNEIIIIIVLILVVVVPNA